MTTIVRKYSMYNYVKFLYGTITGGIDMNKTPTVTAHMWQC